MLWCRKGESGQKLADSLNWGDGVENLGKSRWLSFTGKSNSEAYAEKKRELQMSEESHWVFC